jgi:hypothetical protein
VSGDVDLNGILGLDPYVRNGYLGITVRFMIRGDAPAEKLRAIVEQSRARSAVFDIITNQVPVTIEAATGRTHTRRCSRRSGMDPSRTSSRPALRLPCRRSGGEEFLQNRRELLRPRDGERVVRSRKHDVMGPGQRGPEPLPDLLDDRAPLARNRKGSRVRVSSAQPRSAGKPPIIAPPQALAA